MPTYTEGFHTGEFLLAEGKGKYSREVVTIAAAAGAMKSGTVLGKITASGKYKEYSNANSDGTETAVAVLYNEVPDSASDQKATAIVRFAEVKQAALTGYDANAKPELLAAGIVVR
jgi:hypothetical protein